MIDTKEIATISSVSSIQKSVTIEGMLNRFLSYLDVSKQTHRMYTFGIRQFMKYIKEHGISQPAREDVIEYKKALIAKGLKSATISLYLSAIRRFFDWSETEGLYVNITKGVKSPKQQGGHKRDYLSGTQIKAMLEHATNKIDYAMIALIATTGLSTIEVCRANIGDIHNVGGVWLLDVQGKGHTSKDAYVKLSEPVLKAIQEYLSERGALKENEPLFASRSHRNAGQRLTTRTVSGICKQAMKEAGYNSIRLTAHSLRHSAATLSLLAGMKLSDVQQFMRHSNISTTMIYSHDVDRMNSQCENKVTLSIFGVCA